MQTTQSYQADRQTLPRAIAHLALADEKPNTLELEQWRPRFYTNYNYSCAPPRGLVKTNKGRELADH